MALLPSATHCNSNTSYYALATNAGGAVETAQGFVATGGAAIGPAGTFSAQGDAVPGGLAMFNITRPNGAIQWSIGLDGTPPAPGSVGNNLEIYAYDNSGEFLGAPIGITRATGVVNFSETPTVNGVALQQSQTDFLQAINIPLLSTIPAGKSYQVDMSGVFQVPKTGLYMIEGYVSFNGVLATDQFVCGDGDYFDFNLQPQPVAPGVFSGGVSVDVTPIIPSTAPVPLTATDRTWSNVSIVKLTGGQNYQAILFANNLSDSMAATGSAVLTASIEITALCS